MIRNRLIALKARVVLLAGRERRDRRGERQPGQDRGANPENSQRRSYEAEGEHDQEEDARDEGQAGGQPGQVAGDDPGHRDRGGVHPVERPIPGEATHDRPGRLRCRGLHALRGEEARAPGTRRTTRRRAMPRRCPGRRSCPGRCPSPRGRAPATGMSRRASRARPVDRRGTGTRRPGGHRGCWAGEPGRGRCPSGAGRPRSFDQASTGQAQEDVLKARSSNEDGLRPQPAVVRRGGRGLAVVGIQEDAVGQVFDPVGQPVEPVTKRLLDANREAQLEDFAGRVLARSACGASPRPRSGPCP